MAKRSLTEGDIYNILEEEDEDSSSSDESDEETSDEETDCENDSEDDDTTTPNASCSWVEDAPTPPPPLFSFYGTPGVSPSISLSKDDYLGIFESFFTDELIDIICRETNRYAKQFLDTRRGTLKPKSRCRHWSDTNNPEIKTYLGLLILQGICQKPTIASYFTTRESLATPFFSKVFSQRRFLLISKFIHFVNNDEFSSTDCPNRKLFRIYPILTYLKTKFMDLYTPKQKISIDESLLGWKGRLSFKQYIPSKRKRFGIKFFKLCESETGYIWNIICYTGASTAYENVANEVLPMTEKVVFSLSEKLLNKGYQLYMDNFYNSIDLTEKLQSYKTDVIGTMRINRKGIPLELKNKKFKNKGENYAMFRGKTMVLRWKDKKDLTMISTIHNNDFEEVVGRGGRVENKPVAVVDYNRYMGGVDMSDNCLHFYNVARNRLKKHYIKVFRHLMDMACLNSFIIHKSLGGTNVTRLDFMTELAERLIEKYAVPRSLSSRPPKVPKLTRHLERHFPDIVPPTKKAKPTKRCVVCSKTGIRKESRYWCKDCGVGLCPAPCFKIYHTKN